MVVAASLLSKQHFSAWKTGREQEWMLSHLLYPGSTLWHSPASGTDIPRNSASTWTWGLVPVQDLVFCKGRGVKQIHCVALLLSQARSVLFGIIHSCLCCLVPCTKKKKEYSGILEPEFKYPAFWPTLVAAMIHFTFFPSVFKPNLSLPLSCNCSGNKEDHD